MNFNALQHGGLRQQRELMYQNVNNFGFNDIFTIILIFLFAVST